MFENGLSGKYRLKLFFCVRVTDHICQAGEVELKPIINYFSNEITTRYEI